MSTLNRSLSGIVLIFFLCGQLSAESDQLFYLPLPEDGTRYDSYDDFSGPEPDGRRWPAEYGEGHVTLWQGGKFAAFSVTIDDNNQPDFAGWLERSDRYGWKFTWFIIVHPYVWNVYEDSEGGNQSYFGTWPEIKALHDAGQDVQMHGTLGMNELSTADYEDQVIRSIEIMEREVGNEVLTYAYPGGATGNGADRDYLGVARRHFIAARGTQGSIAPVHLVDYHQIPKSGALIGADGTETRSFDRYDDKRNFRYSQYRGWAMILYHRVQDWDELDRQLEYLKSLEDTFWIDNFTNVAKYMQQRDSASLDITGVSPTQIRFNLTDRMDDSIFDRPLTVKIRVDESWTGANASQAGASLTTSIVEHEGNAYLMVDAIPDRGEVVVNRSN